MLHCDLRGQDERSLDGLFLLAKMTPRPRLRTTFNGQFSTPILMLGTSFEEMSNPWSLVFYVLPPWDQLE